jgi:hypothetical protein
VVVLVPPLSTKLPLSDMHFYLLHFSLIGVIVFVCVYEGESLKISVQALISVQVSLR